MLKPFYNKKKNIDNRLLPAVTAADAGKVLGVTKDGNFGLVEAGGGGGSPWDFNINVTANGEVQGDAVVFTSVDLDRPVSEFIAAVNSNKYITGVIRVSYGEGIPSEYLSIINAGIYDNNTTIRFEGLSFGLGSTLSLSMMTILLNMDGSLFSARYDGGDVSYS